MRYFDNQVNSAININNINVNSLKTIKDACPTNFYSKFGLTIHNGELTFNDCKNDMFLLSCNQDMVIINSDGTEGADINNFLSMFSTYRGSPILGTFSKAVTTFIANTTDGGDNFTPSAAQVSYSPGGGRNTINIAYDMNLILEAAQNNPVINIDFSGSASLILSGGNLTTISLYPSGMGNSIDLTNVIGQGSAGTNIRYHYEGGADTLNYFLYSGDNTGGPTDFLFIGDSSTELSVINSGLNTANIHGFYSGPNTVFIPIVGPAAKNLTQGNCNIYYYGLTSLHFTPTSRNLNFTDSNNFGCYCSYPNNQGVGCDIYKEQVIRNSTDTLSSLFDSINTLANTGFFYTLTKNDGLGQCSPQGHVCDETEHCINDLYYCLSSSEGEVNPANDCKLLISLFGASLLCGVRFMNTQNWGASLSSEEFLSVLSNENI